MKSKPTIPEVLPLVHAYRDKPGNEVGGNLHIVLADGNVSDADVEFCRFAAREAGDMEGEILACILATMSKTQRKKIARLFFR
jgi:hypothetical protein